MRNFAHSITGALSRRSPSSATALAVLLVVPLLAQGAEIEHVKWDNLSMVVGKTVRISLAGGSIEGKAAGVEADALVVDVQKTSDPNAYPKGMLRAPREKLHVLEMQTKGKTGRVVLTTLGALVGVGGGAALADSSNHCTALFTPCPKSSVGVGSGAAFAAVAAVGTAVGYFAGDALDKHWATIEILP